MRRMPVPVSGRRCSVDGVTVDSEPIPDGVQPLLKLRLDDAVRLWAHVQQKVAAAAGDFDQSTDQN